MADIDIQKLFCIFISFHWIFCSLQEICITMTLQWTAVAFFLYAEIGLNLILCIPFISAKRYCSITHVPWLQTLVKFRCHCSWLIVPLACYAAGIWFSAGEYGSGCLHTGTNASSPWLWFWSFFYWVSVNDWLCPRRQHHFTLLLVLRCCTRGAQVLWAWASAWRQSKPECLWPCAHEAVQSSEEPVHIWLLSLSLAVSVFVVMQKLIIILLNCSLTHSFIYLCSVDTASCAGSLAC